MSNSEITQPSPVPAAAFAPSESQPPQATVCLSETSLADGPAPATPESFFIKQEGDDEDLEEKKPSKKRKSWGQELPTPKTNLPPRKRAKTEDEKEQRRIERVLRNRQAAQSSRERKRQEVEKLEGEKSAIEQQNDMLKERLMAVEHDKFLLTQQVAKLTAQLKYQGPSTLTPPSSSPVLEQFDHQKIKDEIDAEYPYVVPTPGLSFGHGASTFGSPSTMTYSPSQSPPTVGLGLDEYSLTVSPDMTQHPAAMLCDLQCQSGEAWSQAPVSSIPPTTRPAATRSSSTTKNPSTSATCSSRPTKSSASSTTVSAPAARASKNTPASTSTRTPTPTTTSHSTISSIWTAPTKRPAATAPSTALHLNTPALMPPRVQQRLLLSSRSLARPHRAATGWALRAGSTSCMKGGDQVGLRWWRCWLDAAGAVGLRCRGGGKAAGEVVEVGNGGGEGEERVFVGIGIGIACSNKNMFDHFPKWCGLMQMNMKSDFNLDIHFMASILICRTFHFHLSAF